jgi:hypothetical protein
MSTVAQLSIGRKVALDRAGVAEHLGVAYTTVNHWCSRRDRFGFPAGFTREGKDWFWRDEIEAFHRAHQAAKLAELTTVDRRGDPDELVGTGEAARVLGYSSYNNLPDALYDQADDVELLPSGRVRRRWYRRTIWALADARTGRQSTGRTPGTTGAYKAHPYADDPRLTTALELLATSQHTQRPELVRLLAARFAISVRSAQRLLATAEHSSDRLPT